MGLRLAAYLCQCMTNAVSRVLAAKGFDILNYLDDFAGVDTTDRAERAVHAQGQTLRLLGLKESPDKACPPSTSMEFLGILFCSRAWTMQVTPVGCVILDWSCLTGTIVNRLQSTSYSPL